ncbi:glycosyltransferase family 39 protein [Patescibacteria group bacterium]|nr:glycosyltransferase family 39 protein [Patescibacteria group bacterium]MBP9709863.1 glycosyltransferase family 39 protein [Patescibacteria group bacterium]
MLSFRRRVWIGVCALLFVMGMAVAFTRPFGEFALNDDWIFARAVRDFQAESFRLDPFIVPVFMGQLLYARGLVSVFGFSFTLLHLSTVLIGMVGMVCLYRLLSSRQGVVVALIASLAIFFHPLFYNVSFSFMTDVPALSFAVIAVFFYWKWWESPRLLWLWLAQIFALYAACIRQNYAAVFVASVFLLLMQPERRKALQGFVGGFLPASLLMGGIYLFLQGRGWWPTNIISFHVFEEKSILVQHVKTQVFFILQYLGFFLIPFLILASSSLSRTRKWIALVLAGLGVGLNMFLFSFYELTFPFFGNVWTKFGLGVRTDVLSGVPEAAWPVAFGVFLTCVAGAASGVLLFFLFDRLWSLLRNGVDRSLEPSRDRGLKIFLFVILLSQIAALLLFRSFDRYYLSLFVPMLLLVSLWIERPFSRGVMKIAILWVGCLAIFSVIGTREYLSLTRIRWMVAQELLQKDVPVFIIDAGYEWLGWHWYKKGNPEILPYYNPSMPWYITTLVPDTTREYVLSYSPVLEGYTLLSVHPYERLFRANGELYLLKQNWMTEEKN